MSEIATLTGGKVVNRNHEEDIEEEEDDIFPPPPFTKEKIGGATNFLEGSLYLSTSTTPGKATHWQDIGGTSVEAAPTRLPASSAPTAIHPLAAPKGWRRFWGPAYLLYEKDPDILVGPFCKWCFDKGKSSLCQSGGKWENRDRGHSRRRVCARVLSVSPHRPGTDLFVISCRALPNEEKSVDEIGSYKKRQMISERIASIGTDNEIPTSTLNFSPYISVLPPGV